MRLIAFFIIAVALAACSQEPAQPEAPLAQTAEQATLAADATRAIVTAPSANARVTSPLVITGIAPAGWYFENQFPVRLVDAQGNEIAMAPATPRVNWTENAEPKHFDAQLAFNVSAETQATLVLQRDMTEEGQTPPEVRVPVTLLPTP